MTDDQQRAREQFDAWAKSANKAVHGFNRVEDMWDAWQAAAAALRAEPNAAALRVAMQSLEQIANAPDDQGAKFNAMGALRFLQTQPVELRAAPEGFVLVPVGYRSVFHDKCWRCYPSFCKCPPTKDEVEAMKGELYLLDQALQREQMRSRVMAGELAGLAQAVQKAKQARLDAGGYDNLPKDLFELAEKAGHAALAARPRGVKDV